MRALELYINQALSHPRVHGENFLTRLNTWSSRKNDSLYVFPLRGLGLNILLDGDPQAGCPAILVLTGNRSYLSV